MPQLSARYKWLFVTGSYYAKTGFDFDDSGSTHGKRVRGHGRRWCSGCWSREHHVVFDLR